MVRRAALTVIAGAFLAFALGLGARTHGSRDVTRYSQMALEMRHDRTLVPTRNRRPYHEATPLAAWTTLAVANVQGAVTPEASRLFPALCSILTVAVLFLLVLRHGGRQLATLACVAATLNYLAITYGRMSRADPALTLGVTAAIAASFHACEARRWGWHVVAGLALALGVAAKGPLAAVLFGGAVGAWLLVEWRPRQLLLAATIPSAVALAVTACWFVPYWRYLGPVESRAFVDQFLLRENLEKFETGYGKAAPFWFYLREVFPAFAPWIFAAVAGLARVAARPKECAPIERLATAWIVTTLLVFSAASGKHVRYLLPVVPALAIVAGAELDRWQSALRARRALGGALALVAGALVLAAPCTVVALSVLAGPGFYAIATGAVAFAGAVVGLVALRRGDGEGALLGTSLACSAAVGFVFAAALPLPRVEQRMSYVVLAETLSGLLPPEPERFTVIDAQGPSSHAGIDETELGLYLGRWVDRAPDERGVRGVVLSRSPVFGRATLATVTWRPTPKDPVETWLLLGSPPYAR